MYGVEVPGEHTRGVRIRKLGELGEWPVLADLRDPAHLPPRALSWRFIRHALRDWRVRCYEILARLRLDVGHCVRRVIERCINIPVDGMVRIPVDERCRSQCGGKLALDVRSSQRSKAGDSGRSPSDCLRQSGHDLAAHAPGEPASLSARGNSDLKRGFLARRGIRETMHCREGEVAEHGLVGHADRHAIRPTCPC
jgi:hypothetical protein